MHTVVDDSSPPGFAHCAAKPRHPAARKRAQVAQ